MNKKIFYIFALIIPILLNAYTPGETSYDFLNIYTDAYGSGCGNTMMFSSFRTMPANMPLHTMKGSIYDMIWLDGVSIGGFGGYYKTTFGYIGSYIDYFNFGNFNKTDENGNIIGSFYAGNIVFSLIYAKNIWDYVNMGIKLKNVYTTIDDMHSFGALLDLSFYGKWNKLKYNFTVSNVGKVLLPYSYTLFDTTITVDTSFVFDTVWVDSFFYIDTTYTYDTTYTVETENINSDMPIAPIIGGGIGFTVPDFDFDIVLEGYYDMGGVWYFRGGVKKELNDYITLKGGFDGKVRKFLQTGESGDFLLGITAGADISYKKFNFSFSYNDMGSLGSSYLFDLSYYIDKETLKKEKGPEESVEIDTVVIDTIKTEITDTTSVIDTLNTDTLNTIEKDTINIVPQDTIMENDTVKQSDTLENKEDSIDIEKNSESGKIEEEKGGDIENDESIEKKENVNDEQNGEKTN